MRGWPCPVLDELHESGPHADQLTAPCLLTIRGIAMLCPSLEPCMAQHKALRHSDAPTCCPILAIEILPLSKKLALCCRGCR